MIDTLSQSGTDRVLDDQLARPAATPPPQAPGFWSGFGSSPFRGLGGAVAQGIAFGAEITGAYGQVAGSLGDVNAGGMFALPTEAERKQQEAARQKMLTQGVDYSNETGDLFRQRAKDIMPDPQTTGTAGQATAGLTNFAAKAVGYSLTTGPAAPLMLGLDTGLTEADKLKREGVDLPTRTKAAAVAGTVAGASIVLPVVGSTALKTAGLVGVAGPGGFMAQNATVHAILKNAGYERISNQYDPFDPVGLALSTLVPAAFGAAFHATRIGPIKTEAQLKTAAQLTPAEQAHSDAYERSPQNLEALQQAIAAEKRPDVKADLQAELDTQTKAAASHADGQIATAVRNDPDLVSAARVQQVASTLDALRLTGDDDIGGMSRHQDAVERAHEQLGAGEKVDVTDVLGDRPLDADRVNAIRDQLNDTSAMRPKLDDEHIATLEPTAQSTLHNMYADAAREKGGFDSALGGIASEVGGKLVAADLKGTERATSKIKSDYAGDPTQVKDLLRATIEVHSAEAAQRAVAGIFEKFEVMPGGRRNLLDPTKAAPDGYRDAKFNVRINGHVAEVQVNMPSMLRAKKEAHDLYKEREAVTRAARDRGEHILSSETAAKVEDLNARMRSIYEPAWTEATSPRNSEASIRPPLRYMDSIGNSRGPDLAQTTHKDGPPAPSETGWPSTSKNSAVGGNLAGSASEAASRFISTSDESLHLVALEKQAADVISVTPELMVQLDGMEHPVLASELLAQVKRDAAQETQDASLLEVAANCFLGSA